MQAFTTPSTQIEAQARAMFTRVVACWAMDLLELRRSGLIVPSTRGGSPDLVTPKGRSRGESPRWGGRGVATALRWRPHCTAA